METLDFADAIDHCISNHPESILKLNIKTTSKKKVLYKTRNFQVIPNDIAMKGGMIIPNKASLTIKISRRPMFQSPTSPMQPFKRQRMQSTPKHKNFSKQNDPPSGDDNDENLIFEKLKDMSLDDDVISSTGHISFDTGESIFQPSTPPVQSDSMNDQAEQECEDSDLLTELKQLLPDVLRTLKNEGQLDMYMKLNKLLSKDKLPLSNVAFLLFKDVVEWYSIDDTRQMRYSAEVRQFWRIGLKLFKGKFLRFMSGMKNKGQDVSRLISPEESSINFAVPDRNCLENLQVASELKNLKPKIIKEMIQIVNDNDKFQAIHGLRKTHPF